MDVSGSSVAGGTSDERALATILQSLQLMQERLLAVEERAAGPEPGNGSNGTPPLTNEASMASAAPSRSDPAESTVIRPRQRLPTPSRFAGSRSKWESWRIEMRLKLRTDSDAIGDGQARFAYVFSCLEGAAAQMVATFVEKSGGEPDTDENRILNYLENIYGDPNREENASHRLQALRQGKEKFTAFLPKFESTMVQAGGMEWPDRVKIAALRNTLNAKLRSALVGNLQLPDVYNDYAAALLKVSSQLAIEENYQREWSKTPRNTPITGRNEDQMDWEPTGARRTKAAKAGSARSKDENGSQRKRAKWVTQEKLDRRREDGRCLRCGSNGHFISKCQLLGALPPEREGKRAAEAASKKGRAGKGQEKDGTSSEEEPRIVTDSESSTEAESGKE